MTHGSVQPLQMYAIGKLRYCQEANMMFEKISGELWTCAIEARDGIFKGTADPKIWSVSGTNYIGK